MPTLNALVEWALAEQKKGKGSLHVNHPVIMEEENAKRQVNAPDEKGKRKTRIAWDANDPDSFAEFHKEREKYIRAAGGNPVLGTDAMICALRMFEFEDVRKFVEAIAAAKEAVRGHS